MNFPLVNSQPALGLPSFLKPQVRWVPEIAGQVARLGTLAALGYTGFQAYASGAYSVADASLLQNAALLISPVLAARFNSSAAKNLATRVLWNPIRKETLNDPDQVINKAVLTSDSAKAAVEQAAPGTLGHFGEYFAAMKKKSLTEGLLAAGVGAFLTVSYLSQFGG